MSEAFRKICLHYQALYETNKFTEFTGATKRKNEKLKTTSKLIDMRVHLS